MAPRRRVPKRRKHMFTVRAGAEEFVVLAVNKQSAERSVRHFRDVAVSATKLERVKARGLA